MADNGIYQWNEHYPNRAVFENDVLRKELYVLEKENSIIGCVVVSAFMDNDYRTVKWLTPNMDNIYIHRLAIHPKKQGEGYAQELMNYAEDIGKETHRKSIRLDTFSKNKRNQYFYEKRGYKRLETIYFPDQSEFAFYCYEHIL